MAEVHPDFGEASTYSEHSRGDLIGYWQQNEWDTEPKVYHGEILWVCAPTSERGALYMVAPSTPSGWLDHVYPSDIVIQP